MGSPKATLPFHDLSKRHYGVNRVNSAAYAQAARVCLDRYHTSPVDFTIGHNGTKIEVECVWKVTRKRTRRNLKNDDDATRDGAYSFAIAGVEVMEGLFAVSRAETLTGADYYVALAGTDPDDLENCIRLEIAGVNAGGINIVRKRLNLKVKQAARGKSNLPALAAVVGFKAKVILIKKVEIP